MQNVKRRIENAECKVQSEKEMYKSTKLEFILLSQSQPKSNTFEETYFS